jgi:hypothetical protein
MDERVPSDGRFGPSSVPHLPSLEAQDTSNGRTTHWLASMHLICYGPVP